MATILSFKSADALVNVDHVGVEVTIRCKGTGERCDSDNEIPGCGRTLSVKTGEITYCECGLPYSLKLSATVWVGKAREAAAWEIERLQQR